MFDGIDVAHTMISGYFNYVDAPFYDLLILPRPLAWAEISLPFRQNLL